MAITLATWWLATGLFLASGANSSPGQVVLVVVQQLPATPEEVAARVLDQARRSAVLDRQDAEFQAQIDQLVRDIEISRQDSEKSALFMLRLRAYSAFVDTAFRLHMRVNKDVLYLTGIWLPMPAFYFTPLINLPAK